MSGLRGIESLGRLRLRSLELGSHGSNVRTQQLALSLDDALFVFERTPLAMCFARAALVQRELHTQRRRFARVLDHELLQLQR